MKSSVKTVPSRSMRSVWKFRERQDVGQAGCPKSNLIILGFTKHRRGPPSIPSYPYTKGYQLSDRVTLC